MLSNIKRGDIFYADLGDNKEYVFSKIRPVVIIQNNFINEHASTVIVAPIISRIRRGKKIPTHVEISNKDSNLNNKENTIIIEQLGCIDKKKLLEKISTLNYKIVYEIEKALIIATGSEESLKDEDKITIEKLYEDFNKRYEDINKILIPTSNSVQYIEKGFKKSNSFINQIKGYLIGGIIGGIIGLVLPYLINITKILCKNL